MMKTIEIIANTFAKAHPIDANLLDDSQKEPLVKGTKLEVVAVGTGLERGHIKVTLAKNAAGEQVVIDGRNTVYLYKAHTNYKDNPNRCSEEGKQMIKHFESCVLEAYPDPGTGGDPWTIGYGSTGDNVYKGLTITQPIAEAWLTNDLARFEIAVRELVKVPLTQNQFDALCSFAFNCGTGSLETSTLLRKLNNHQYKEAAEEFIKWCKGASGVLEGLRRRRLAETAMFLGKDWEDYKE